MSNIPGVVTPGWSVPATRMVFEKPGGKLVTDDLGNTFEIDGNIRLIGLAVLEYALRFKEAGIPGINFSIFAFDFSDGIKVKARARNNDPERVRVVTDLVEEINKIIELKAFW